MSDQGKKPDETGSQESRFLPGARIEAENIKATNVVSGVQYNTYTYQQDQKYPLPYSAPVVLNTFRIAQANAPGC